MEKNIAICVGLPDEFRKEVAETYVKTFPHKFKTIMGPRPRACKVLELDMDEECAIVASENGEFAGVAGIQFGNKRLVQSRKRTFIRTFGVVEGLVRFGAFQVISKTSESKVLTFDGLVVPEKMRGKGVGSRLLQGVKDYATDRGFTSLKLDVLDTNPRAKKLYERLGFKPVKTRQYPYLDFLGFSGVTTMALSVS